jgi:Glyoxalase-like domain
MNIKMPATLGEDFREHGFRWRVMADPEGNEFCLVYEQPTR